MGTGLYIGLVHINNGSNIKTSLEVYKERLIKEQILH